MYGILEVIIRSAVIYLFIITAIRIFGKRELSQLSVIDLVFILLISNAVQNSMVGSNVSLLGGIVAGGTLFTLNYILRNIFYKSKRLTTLVEGQPLMLVYKGKPVKEHLQKAKMSEEELKAVLREHGVERMSDVDFAVLETDGNISILSNDFKRKTIERRKANKIIEKPTP